VGTNALGNPKSQAQISGGWPRVLRDRARRAAGARAPRSLRFAQPRR